MESLIVFQIVSFVVTNEYKMIHPGIMIQFWLHAFLNGVAILAMIS